MSKIFKREEQKKHLQLQHCYADQWTFVCGLMSSQNKSVMAILNFVKMLLSLY